MKNFIAIFLFSLGLAAQAAEVDPPRPLLSWLTTNSIATPPDDSYVLGVAGGLPSWVSPGTNATFINTILTNTTFNTYIATNVFNTFNSTTAVHTTLNISGKASVSYFVLTNQIAYVPKTWSGPSNTFDLSLATGAKEQNYSTVTPVRVTGLTFDAGYVEQGLLAITNAASTNITITFAAGFRFPATDTSTTYTVTNGDYAEILIDYHAGPTNTVTRVWH